MSLPFPHMVLVVLRSSTMPPSGESSIGFAASPLLGLPPGDRVVVGCHGSPSAIAGPPAGGVNVVRRLKVAVLASGLVVSLALPAQAGLAAPARLGPQTRLLVTVDPSAHAAVERQVHAVGGRVSRDLPLVSAMAVSVPAAAAASIAAVPGVRSATPDAAVQVLGTAGGDSGPSVYRQVVGSDAAERAGLDGAGVGVALVDTGIADVPDLAGQVQPVRDDTGVQRACVNLTGEE